MFRSIVLPLMLQAPLFVASAEVYRCEVDGKAVFSDAPCGTDAEELDLKYPKPNAEDLAAARERSEEASDNSDEAVLRQKIRLVDRKIARLERERDAELARIDGRVIAGGDAGAVATLALKKTQDRDAANTEWNDKIAREEKKLERLRRQLDEEVRRD